MSTPTDSQLQALRASARVLRIPMRTKFRGVLEREVLLFEGSHGWAEWSPFLEYSDDEAAVWLAAALDFANNPHDELLRQSIGVNATLPAVAPADVAGILGRFGAFRTVKIKVAEPGQKMADDLARIREVRALYPAAKIRLDANGGYSVGNAMQLGHRLTHAGIQIEYFEQPVATVDELAKLRPALNDLGIRVAADESIRKAADPMAVVRAEAADIVVVKAAPLGGITRALAICSEAGLPAVISSALETSVGISMGLHLAAKLPLMEYDCGLATVALLADDVCDLSLTPIEGRIEVRRVAPSDERMTRLAANDERSSWWLDRLERCAQLL